MIIKKRDDFINYHDPEKIIKIVRKITKIFHYFLTIKAFHKKNLQLYFISNEYKKS